MNRARARQRDVDGVLLLDKPAGITSHTAVQRVRRLFDAAKGGHTGTLDPLATGLLPVCLGEATKFSHALLEADKTYLATLQLGVVTTTGDMEGEILQRAPVNVERDQIAAVLEHFTGRIEQVPPMYSAIKQAGQPLYKIAREGREVHREPRPVFIHRLVLVGLSGDTLSLRVTCSKGTYIRVLAEDIGRALGCGACLSALRREAVGGFGLDSGALTLESLEAKTVPERDAALLPVDALLAGLPRCDLDAAGRRRLTLGQPVDLPGARVTGLARVYGPDRDFLGVAEVTVPGRIVPKRLTHTGREPAR